LSNTTGSSPSQYVFSLVEIEVVSLKYFLLFPQGDEEAFERNFLPSKVTCSCFVFAPPRLIILLQSHMAASRKPADFENAQIREAAVEEVSKLVPPSSVSSGKDRRSLPSPGLFVVSFCAFKLRYSGGTGAHFFAGLLRFLRLHTCTSKSVLTIHPLRYIIIDLRIGK
jgi:hypothetical protein